MSDFSKITRGGRLKSCSNVKCTTNRKAGEIEYVIAALQIERSAINLVAAICLDQGNAGEKQISFALLLERDCQEESVLTCPGALYPIFKNSKSSRFSRVGLVYSIVESH